MPTINGTAGNDTIHGTSGNDQIFPGAGTDVISGGGGNDIIAGSNSDLTDDTVTDLSSGDVIAVSGITQESFWFSYDSVAGHLQWSGITTGDVGLGVFGSIELSNYPAGTFTENFVSAANGQPAYVDLQFHAYDALNDFSGDNHSDVLLRNDDGRLTQWTGTANGGFHPSNSVTSIDSQWQIAATGDFNGDGRQDILWHRSDGALTDYLANQYGFFSPNSAHELEVVDPQWQIAGVGDINGDGRDDIVWHRADGVVTDWLGNADGSFTPNGANLLEVVDPQWQIAGIGDINGDNRDDVLWRRTDGALTDWLGNTNGGLSPNAGNLLTVVDPQWQIAGVADINGDQRDDILWHRPDGALTDWLGSGTGGLTPNSSNFLSVVSTDWQVAALGDYNGDGRNDILWRNTDGRLTDWLGNANGSFTDNAANALTTVDTHWHVQPIEHMV